MITNETVRRKKLVFSKFKAYYARRTKAILDTILCICMAKSYTERGRSSYWKREGCILKEGVYTERGRSSY